MLQLLNTQLPIGFGNRPFAMHPFGLDPIEPGTLIWQWAHHHATAAFPLDTLVVCLAPRPHGVANVPRGIVPHRQQCRFAFSGQPFRQPPQNLLRHGTGRPTVPKAQEHLLCICP
jgi:hypothetical protein